MCMIDDAEPCEFYQRKTVKAAKPHKCCECGREIAKGEKYQFASIKFEGRFDCFHTCAHCDAASQWLEEVCGGYRHNGLYEEMTEHLDEYSHEGEDMRMMFLARCIVGFRRDWKFLNKPGLMAIPKLLLPIPALEKQTVKI